MSAATGAGTPGLRYSVEINEMRQLRPCPGSPNCVSSHSENNKPRMQPIAYSGDARDAQRRLEDIVRGLPRATIVESTPDYFAAEFRSLIFRFVDEAQFIFDEERHLIHFRSGARTGYSDFGVNRARMDGIIAAFAKGGK